MIITCSLGYLKGHRDTLFELALPVHKYSVISSLGFETVNKIFLEFEKPIFSKANAGIAFAWENTTEKVDRRNWFKRLFGFDSIFTDPRVVVGRSSCHGGVTRQTNY